MKQPATILCFLLLALTVICSAQKKPAVTLQVDWPTYLAQHDLLWDRVPVDYFDGAFVGNGLLGAILFKDDTEPNTLRFEIGRTDVYDHRSLETPVAYGRERLPIGQLLVTPVGAITKTSLRTDLWHAEIRGELTTTAGTITFRCFVPSDDEVIVLTLTSTGQEQNAKIWFRPQQADSPRYIVKKPLGGEKDGYVYCHNPPFYKEQLSGIEVITQPLLVGDDYATAWHEKIDANHNRTVLVSVANRWAKTGKAATGSAQDAVATILATEKKDLNALEKAHRAWWHAYYSASFVTFSDARLESFYWIQLYKLGSATRPNRPVIDLMGPWFKPTQWPCLWMNLNVQLTYYLFGIANHTDMEDNLYQLIDRHTDQLIANVPPEFQVDCAGIRNPVGYNDLTAPLFLSDDKNNDKELNIIVLPWLMQQYYLHNRRTMDDVRLREKIYPILRRAFNVYLRILYIGEDGRYHIPYTFSDEYGNAKETSLNIALARWGFKALIASAKRLKINDPLLPRWKVVLANMADYNINENGIMIGKDVPLAKPHRHYSHLFAIFPLYDMTIDNAPERLSMMRTSIQHFTDLEGDNCMYKFSGASSLWASIGDGDQALKWLNRSLELLPRFGIPPAPARIPTATQNTFYSERENPTFESPISSARSMLDMLLQSWGGTIRVFPALPSSWKEASFHDLRTEGAFLISAVRKGGKTQFIRVKSLAGEPCVLKTDFDGPIHLTGSINATLHQRNGLMDLTLRKGEEVILYTGEKPTQFRVSPVLMSPNERNSWGGREK